MKLKKKSFKKDLRKPEPTRKTRDLSHKILITS